MPIGLDGMKIDRMLFQKFEEKVTGDATVQALVEDDRWEQAAAYVVEHLLDKPTEFFTLDKLRKAAGVDRRLGLREILEKVFGRISRFKSKEELLEDEFNKFLFANHDRRKSSTWPPCATSSRRMPPTRRSARFWTASELTELNTNATLGMADFKAVPEPWRKRIPEYIKDYVPLNTSFA